MAARRSGGVVWICPATWGGRPLSGRVRTRVGRRRKRAEGDFVGGSLNPLTGKGIALDELGAIPRCLPSRPDAALSMPDRPGRGLVDRVLRVAFELVQVRHCEPGGPHARGETVGGGDSDVR